MKRRRWLITAAVAVIIVSSACGSGSGDGGPTDQELRSALQDRLDATEAESDCLVAYLREDYTSDQLQTLSDDGLAALPQGLWEPYFTSALACLTTADSQP